MKILDAWKMEQWSVSDIQEMINLHLHIESLGLKFDVVLRDYLKVKDEKICPECGLEMVLTSVNTHPSNQIGGNAKTMWYCINQDCSHTIVNEMEEK